MDLQKLDQFDAHTIKEHTKEVIGCIIDASGGSMVVSLEGDGASVMSRELLVLQSCCVQSNFILLVNICNGARL